MFVYILLRSYWIVIWDMWNADLTPREGRNSKIARVQAHFSSPHSSRRLRRLSVAAPPPLPIKWACSQARWGWWGSSVLYFTRTRSLWARLICLGRNEFAFRLQTKIHLWQCLLKSSRNLSALQNKQKTRKGILPFVTEYRPSMPDLKHILMNKWHLIQNQPLLRNIFKNPPLISYRKGRSLKDVLVRAKLWGLWISYPDQ